MKFKAKITRMVDGNSKIKAIADVSFEGGFRVTGIKVCQGSKGLFIGMPSNSYTNSDGEKKYTDIFFPTTKEARDALTKEVISRYKAELSQTQEQSQTASEEPTPPEPDWGEPGFEDGF
ncbi:MAG: SpoVG family protein [Ruminococcus sp.]|nr:SpoVG family protein [Ruminococcus sp.]